jgi:hypothetical protein
MSRDGKGNGLGTQWSHDAVPLSQQSPPTQSVRVEMGPGRFSGFRLLLKNTFALDGVSKRFVWMVAGSVLCVVRVLRGELLLRPARSTFP